MVLNGAIEHKASLKGEATGAHEELTLMPVITGQADEFKVIYAPNGCSLDFILSDDDDIDDDDDFEEDDDYEDDDYEDEDDDLDDDDDEEDDDYEDEDDDFDDEDDEDWDDDE